MDNENTKFVILECEDSTLCSVGEQWRLCGGIICALIFRNETAEWGLII